MPFTTVLDDFNTGANQALSARAGWSASHLYPGTADFTTDSVPTKAVSTGNSDNAWGTNFTDVEVYMTVAAAPAQQTDLYARWSGSGTMNGYSLFSFSATGGNLFYLARIDNNVHTTLSSQPVQVLGALDSIGLRVVGSALEGWYKSSGGAWTMLVSATDSTYTGAGMIGMDNYSSGDAITEFGANAPPAAVQPVRRSAIRRA